MICTGDFKNLDERYQEYVFKGETERKFETFVRIVSDQDPLKKEVVHLIKEKPDLPVALTPDFRQIKWLKDSFPKFVHVEAARPRLNDSTIGTAKFFNMIMDSPSIEYCNDVFSCLGLHYRRINREKLRDLDFEVDVSLNNVGAGIHGLTHLCDKIYDWKQSGGVIAIEEPESHVNERQLAPLTKFLVHEGLSLPTGQMIVECHSELMVLQLENLLKHQVITPEQLSVFVVVKEEEGTKVTTIHMDEFGNMDERWPDGGFFPARSKIVDEYYKGR